MTDFSFRDIYNAKIVNIYFRNTYETSINVLLDNGLMFSIYGDETLEWGIKNNEATNE